MLRTPTSTSTMSIPLRQQLISALTCTPQDTLTRHHFSFQIPGSRPAPSPTFSRLSLLFLAGVSLTTLVADLAPLCIRLRLCTKLWPKNVASWSQ